MPAAFGVPAEGPCCASQGFGKGSEFREQGIRRCTRLLDLGGRKQPREQIGITQQFRRITAEHWYGPNHLSSAAGKMNDVVSGSVHDKLSLLAPSGGTFGGS